MSLEELRQRLDSIDRRVVELVAERQAVIRDIAAAKQSTGFPLRDYRRETEVLEAARGNAAQMEISPDVAEAVMRLLIRYSLTVQEQSRMVAHRAGGGQRALVIGGAGKIGNWFAQFLYSQGFEVEIADPLATDKALAIENWQDSDLKQEYIVVAVPLGEMNDILLGLAERRPPGVVFDVASLKSPLRSGFKALEDAGVRVASLHPMFGPDVEVLSGRHVVYIDLGLDEPLARVRALFAPTMAQQVTLSLEEHDRLIAYVLGLSHAVNIAFFTALASSGETAPRLLEISSTTFAAQFDIARTVAHESAKLYYEIQRLNDFGAQSLDALSDAVETISAAVKRGDKEKFVALMDSGRKYTANRRRNANR